MQISDPARVRQLHTSWGYRYRVDPGTLRVEGDAVVFDSRSPGSGAVERISIHTSSIAAVMEEGR